MKRSEVISQNSALPYIAMLLGAMLTILMLQEVDPTWYDPWIAPNATVVNLAQPAAVIHSSQSPVATNQGKQSAMFVSHGPNAGKVRAKDAQLDHSRHNTAHKNGGTSSAGSPSLGG